MKVKGVPFYRKIDDIPSYITGAELEDVRQYKKAYDNLGKERERARKNQSPLLVSDVIKQPSIPPLVLSEVRPRSTLPVPLSLAEIAEKDIEPTVTFTDAWTPVVHVPEQSNQEYAAEMYTKLMSHNDASLSRAEWSKLHNIYSYIFDHYIPDMLKEKPELQGLKDQIWGMFDYKKITLIGDRDSIWLINSNLKREKIAKENKKNKILNTPIPEKKAFLAPLFDSKEPIKISIPDFVPMCV